MCFAPNIIINGKFRGGVKNYIRTERDKYGNIRDLGSRMQQQKERELKELIKTGKATIIPCGQCLQCRINHAKNWATRLELEAQSYNNVQFLTLTYDDEHVPVVDAYTGETKEGLTTAEAIDLYNQQAMVYIKAEKPEEAAKIGWTYRLRLTLRKRDIQQFCDRLNKYCQSNGLLERGKSNIRYFYCGEYGDQTHRPHYHMILYGVKIPDPILWSKNNGNPLFTSEMMTKEWGKGNVLIGAATYESMQYVARYALKKTINNPSKQWWIDAGMEPEFISMSNKPGIGREWFENHKSIYDDDYGGKDIVLAKGRIGKIPKYFDALMDAELIAEGAELEEIKQYNPDNIEEAPTIRVHSKKMQDIKRKRRENAQKSMDAKMRQHTGVGMLEYIEQQEKIYKSRNKYAAMSRDKA